MGRVSNFSGLKSALIKTIAFIEMGWCIWGQNGFSQLPQALSNLQVLCSVSLMGAEYCSQSPLRFWGTWCHLFHKWWRQVVDAPCLHSRTDWTGPCASRSTWGCLCLWQGVGSRWPLKISFSPNHSVIPDGTKLGVLLLNASSYKELCLHFVARQRVRSINNLLTGSPQSIGRTSFGESDTSLEKHI